MNSDHDPTPPPLPASVSSKLAEYRRRIWTTKTLEAVAAALFGLALSYLAVFALDRVMETPSWARLALLVLGLVGGAVFLPMQIARWVGGHASLKSVARRIATEDIATGDRILGVMALTGNSEEYVRSPELAQAAIRQGEASLIGQDLSHTLPASRHRGWGALAGLGVAATAAGFVIAPAAAKNSLARWMRPTANIERYTFTRLAEHDSHQVIARFEEFSFRVALEADTEREPKAASLALKSGETLTADLQDGGYTFALAGIGDEVAATLSVGDYRGKLSFEPVDRPEVSEAVASIRLPSYLELPAPLTKDVRGGSLGVVEGSAVSLTAELTRALRSAEWSAAPVSIEGATLTTEASVVTDSANTELAWVDVHGLSGTVPFKLGLRARPDGKPTISTEGLQSNTILLHNQAMAFTVRSSDDFGVRKVGLEWEGFGELEGEATLAKGDKMLGLGEPDSARLDLQATLHPKLLGIDPQYVRVRAFAIDALPGRERTYSAPIEVQVMTEADHMIWLTRALAGWYDEATEVRDQEHNLLQVNEELFTLSNDELRTAATQRKIAEQAAAERSNGRRLNRLTGTGEQLLAEAARNSQFNANTMDDWAEMMAALGAIADTSMPSVAALLAKAAKAEPSSAASAKSPESSGLAGRNQSEVEKTASEGGAEVELPSAPKVADTESSFNDPSAPPPPGEADAKAPPANLTLADTTVEGGGPKTEPAEPAPADSTASETPGPTKEELAKALAEQRALMAEFERVAGKISEILSDLEGSTFVKRLKALARAETGVAQNLDATLADTFGADEIPDSMDATLVSVSKVQEKSAQRASLVREDLAAYVERMKGAGKDPAKFKTVHTEMGEVGVTREMAAIHDLTEISRSGEAIAGAENLADDLDRWAEILVGPG